VGTITCTHKEAAQLFVKYYRSGGYKYARLLEAKRDENGERYDIVHDQLGRVVNEDEGIFKNRARGVYKFSLDEGYRDIGTPEAYLEQTYGSKIELILDFGSEYVFAEALRKEGIWDVFSSIMPEKSDTLMALVLHSMLWTEARQFAEDFWRTSYARIAFPNARLKSQRISEFLAELGDEAIFRRFFDAYLGYVISKSKTTKHSIIVDSTGLQNAGHMDLTAVNVHNGVVSNEIRLILVMDRTTGYPLYFRYVKGNILDVNSLANTIAALKQYGVEVDHCILDAGYYCGDNISDMDIEEIPYLLRLRAGNNTYDSLIAEHVGGLDTYENRVIYGNRVIFLKCVPVNFHGSQAFAYVSIDHAVQADERRKIFMKKPSEFKSDADREEQLRTSGAFILISKLKVSVDEILPLYYSRQAVEQAFDFGKNYANLLPLRIHSEETLRGHLLVSFMATVSIMTIDRLFTAAHPRAKNKRTLNFIQARSCLRQMKCQVFDDCISVVEPDRKSNDVLKALKVSYVNTIAR
jgi:hypothetical protein